MATTTTIRGPVDCINAALVQIGWESQIGSLWDGSKAAQNALAIYGQTRDDLLRSGDWGFAQVTAVMTLLKSAPLGGYIPGVNPWDPATSPPPPWAYSYQYFPDCLRVRSVKPMPLFIINYDPQPNPFAIIDDTSYSPSQKVICCNVQYALCVYVRQETNPLLWDSNFTETLIDRLGERLAAGLTGPDAAKLSAGVEQGDVARAKMEQG